MVYRCFLGNKFDIILSVMYTCLKMKRQTTITKANNAGISSTTELGPSISVVVVEPESGYHNWQTGQTLI